MKRPKIEWSKEEIETVMNYYLSLDCISNKERVDKTFNNLYNNNNKFGHFRTLSNLRRFLSTEVAKRNITIFAYKNPPKGFYMIPGTKWHCMDKNLNVLNMKTGKFRNPSKTNSGVFLINLADEKLFTKSASRIYAELFLDISKPYQIQSNGIPIQTEKHKKRGLNHLPKKEFSEWLKNIEL